MMIGDTIICTLVIWGQIKVIIIPVVIIEQMGHTIHSVSSTVETGYEKNVQFVFVVRMVFGNGGKFNWC